MRLLFLCLLGMALFAPAAQARPVSYPGGWTSMLTNNGEMHGAHIHYSPTAKYSVGYKFEYWRDAEYALHAVQVNNLLKRWNGRDSQANLYLKSGAGVSLDNGKAAPAAFTGLAADWEDRRYFTSYEARYTEGADIDGFYMHSARVGITPYVGDYGDLHTWLMLEVSHTPEDNQPFTVTPLVRLFKGTHLIEAGVSNHGSFLFNWVARY